jgi:cysteine-rich repeat protein
MCRLDTSQCTGDENCTDGERDQDGDGNLDCDDSDCAAACANSCTALETLSDPARVDGETFQHAAQLRGSCLPSDVTSGPEVVYRFTAAHTGVLAAELRSDSATDFTLSVRSTCATDASEIGCAQTNSGFQARDLLRVPITQNQTVFIVVDGTGNASAGGYSLSVASRAVVCGDGHRDGSEGCDDGNSRSLDGCSAACALESDETEPNGSVGQADAYTGYPFFAAISTPDDVDVFSIALPAGHTRLLAETFDLGDGACAKYLLDSRLEILDGAGVVREQNGDTRSSFCSRVEKTGLSAGTYYVRVTSEGQKPTFPYILNVNSSP